jgi:hypothetical protein
MVAPWASIRSRAASNRSKSSGEMTPAATIAFRAAHAGGRSSPWGLMMLNPPR